LESGGEEVKKATKETCTGAKETALIAQRLGKTAIAGTKVQISPLGEKE